MAKPKDAQKTYVRPTPAARHALRRLTADMKAPGFFGDDLNQEDFVAATWLWMATLDPADVARGVAAHLDAVRAHWEAAEAPAPDTVGRPFDPATGAPAPAPAPRRKRKGAG